MKRLPVDLSLKTVTTKVSVKAWDRAQELKAKYDVRLSDIISIALLHMPEADIERIIGEQTAALEGLSKPTRNLLRDLDSLTPEERALLRDQLD